MQISAIIFVHCIAIESIAKWCMIESHYLTYFSNVKHFFFLVGIP